MDTDDPTDMHDEARTVHYLKEAAMKKEKHQNLHTSCPGDDAFTTSPHLFNTLLRHVLDGRCIMEIAKSVMNIKVV